MEQVKIKLNGGIMPKKANPTDAAYDLYVPQDVELRNGRQVIDLKFSMELPQGYAATIQPRSGFSAKGMECTGFRSNRVDADVIRGLVDEKYRGSVGVIVICRDESVRMHPVRLDKGTRIAQMQIVKVPETELVEVGELDMSNDRGGGFGHTGAK